MKGRDCIRVALWNLMAFKRQSIKIIIGMTTVVILIFCIMGYYLVFRQQMRKLESNYQPGCYVEKDIESVSWEKYQQIMNTLGERETEIPYAERSVLVALSLLPEAEEAAEVGTEEAEEAKEAEEAVETKISHAAMTIDGKNYIGKSDILSGIRPEKEAWSTNQVNIALWTDSHLFPSAVREQHEHGNNWYMGRLPEQEGEVMISDAMLKEFGIALEEQEKLIGKKMTLFLENNKYTAFENYTLTGVFEAPILKTREQTSIYDYMQHIYVNLDARTKELYKIDRGSIRYYTETPDELLACYEQAEKIDEDFMLSRYGDIYETMSGQVAAISEILLYVLMSFIFTVTVYMLCVLYFFFQQNSSFMSLQRVLGMPERNVFQIIFWELLFFCIFSLVLGIYIGMYILYGFKYVYDYTGVYDYAGLLAFRFDGNMLLVSALVSFVCCFGISGIFGTTYFLHWKQNNLL